MIVQCADKTLREITGGMVVDIDDRSDASTAGACVLRGLLDSSAGQISNRFRPTLVAARRDYAVKIDHEVVVDSNRYPLHPATSQMSTLKGRFVNSGPT